MIRTFTLSLFYNICKTKSVQNKIEAFIQHKIDNSGTKRTHLCQHLANNTSFSLYFQDLDEAALFAEPNLFCHFSQGIGEPKYLPVANFQDLNKILVEALDNYNEVNAVMNLVLFEDAIYHILRINRILESPRGNALLVGVGGSGKQSLSRIAAFISGLDVFQITLRKGVYKPSCTI